MNIAENIKRYRRQLGMEQRELAERLQVSDKTISSWECGRTEPKMGAVEKMSEIFGCTTTDLISGPAEEVTREPARASYGYEVTEDEYKLILDFRHSDADTKKMVRRMLAYAQLIGGLSHDD